MNINPADVPRILGEVHTALRIDITTARHPEVAVNAISAIDILVRDVAHLLIEYGIDHTDLPLRYAGNRIIGPGSRLRSIHLLWAALDLLEVNPDLASKLGRIARNAAISTGSVQAVAVLADAVDENEKASLADQFADIRDWSPHIPKEEPCA